MTTIRRSQEERSAATRERLLDATIETLVEKGYGRTTTTEIVRRAGLSRGAQVHHFPTKAELVNSAVAHLAFKREQEIRAEFARLDPKADRVSAAIDLLWSGYAGPLFTAALEIIVAARTDPELREAFATLNLNVTRGIEGFVGDTFGPQVLRKRSFRNVLELTVNLMHGLALSRMTEKREGNADRLVEVWKDVVRPIFEDMSKAS
ncbi:MAG: TetR/AcrR family transcriptional regulator [Actinomycetota bacterium]